MGEALQAGKTNWSWIVTSIIPIICLKDTLLTEYFEKKRASYLTDPEYGVCILTITDMFDTVKPPPSSSYKFFHVLLI